MRLASITRDWLRWDLHMFSSFHLFVDWSAEEKSEKEFMMLDFQIWTSRFPDGVVSVLSPLPTYVPVHFLLG